MELAPYEPRVILHLYDFHKISVWRGTNNFQSMRNHRLFVLAVELVTVAMTLGDFHFPVSLLRVGTSREDTWVSAQPHRAAKVVDAAQFAQLVDHPVRRGRIKFGDVCVCQSANVSGKLNHTALHS